MKRVIAKTRAVKEAKIEALLVDAVEKLGGMCIKVRALGSRGLFDRLIVLPGGRIIFCEVKRPRGGRVSPHQMEYIRTFSELGVEIAIVKTEADIVALLR